MDTKKKMFELERASIEEFKTKNKIPVNIVLDNVRSAYNVGAIFRTADAFCVKKIYLCGITLSPPHKELRKTALGATESVEWEYIEDINSFILTLKQSEPDVLIYAIEQTKNSLSLSSIQLNRANEYYLIFGNEVEGVQENIIRNCTACIEVPQEGTKHSLNVSVCAGVVLWEFFRQLS